MPQLMRSLLDWINCKDDLPVPIKASIAHYQYATIHPYYDGNGRTARLLTTLVLHLHGYGLKGLYALEEYYARQLQDYYEALTVGPSHNYYLGRPEADITKWLVYFVRGMAVSFQNVEGQARAEAERGGGDQTRALRNLDARQRKALSLFVDHEEITGKQIADLFGLQARAAAVIAQNWVEGEFLTMSNASKKSRRYRLTPQYEALIEG